MARAGNCGRSQRCQRCQSEWLLCVGLACSAFCLLVLGCLGQAQTRNRIDEMMNVTFVRYDSRFDPDLYNWAIADHGTR